jgi:hypothetical protein
MAGANNGPYRQDFYPPVPTRLTRYLRTSVVWQLVRFLVIGWRIVKLLVKPQG